jgi:hypothetical protein
MLLSGGLDRAIGAFPQLGSPIDYHSRFVAVLCPPETDWRDVSPVRPFSSRPTAQGTASGTLQTTNVRPLALAPTSVERRTQPATSAASPIVGIPLSMGTKSLQDQYQTVSRRKESRLQRFNFVEGFEGRCVIPSSLDHETLSGGRVLRLETQATQQCYCSGWTQHQRTAWQPACRSRLHSCGVRKIARGEASGGLCLAPLSSQASWPPSSRLF